MYHLNYANFKDELECGIKIGLEKAIKSNGDADAIAGKKQ